MHLRPEPWTTRGPYSAPVAPYLDWKGKMRGAEGDGRTGMLCSFSTSELWRKRLLFWPSKHSNFDIIIFLRLCNPRSKYDSDLIRYSSLHSVNLILFSLLLVHLILHASPHQSPLPPSTSIATSAFYSRLKGVPRGQSHCRSGLATLPSVGAIPY